MEISASQVKALRDRSGAGMMDCKKALEETQGDMEQAVEWLSKKWISRGEWRAGRAASQQIERKQGISLLLRGVRFAQRIQQIVSRRTRFA